MPPKVKKKAVVVEKRGAKSKASVEERSEAKNSDDEALLPEQIFEPGSDDEVKPGEIDAMGQYYLEELDFLRLQSRKERARACRAQSETLRIRADLDRLNMNAQIDRYVKQAASFERAALAHESSIQETLTELSKKYNIDFKDRTVSIDEDVGKIVATDPTKGLPRLKKEPED